MEEREIEKDINREIDDFSLLSEIIEDNIDDNEDIDLIEDIDTYNKSRLHGGIKLALILVATGIVGFMFSGILMSVANWIIFN